MKHSPERTEIRADINNADVAYFRLERYPDFIRCAMLLNAHISGILAATLKLTYDFVVYTSLDLDLIQKHAKLAAKPAISRTAQCPALPSVPVPDGAQCPALPSVPVPDGAQCPALPSVPVPDGAHGAQPYLVFPYQTVPSAPCLVFPYQTVPSAQPCLVFPYQTVPSAQPCLVFPYQTVPSPA